MKLELEIPPWAEQIVSDLTDMERNPHPVDRAKVRQFTLTLPDDVYFEYAYLDATGRMRPDPENPQRAENPWYPNASAVYGPRYAPDLYAAPSAEASGRSERHRLESVALGQSWRLVTYTPVGHDEAALPVVYLQDGVAYLRVARLAAVLEALLAAGEVRPAHLVFVEPNDRSSEYRFNDTYRMFFIHELLPFAEARLRSSGVRVAMGASLGGLMSASLGLHHPELFGTVVAQSGAFLGRPDAPDPYRNERSWLLERFGAGQGATLRWYLETGTLEWLLEVNRRAAAALRELGADLEYRERNAGHNWVNWRNGLAAALRFALPPEG